MFDKASRYQWRIDQLIATKLGQTLEKQQRRGAMDIDDKGLVLPPEEWSFIPKGNHPSGEFFGAKAWCKFQGVVGEASDVHRSPLLPCRSVDGDAHGVEDTQLEP